MRRKLVIGGAVSAVALLSTATPAFAQGLDELEGVEAVQAALDNTWILIAAILVIFMQAGFALVEAGLTRAKSVANIMMKNMMDFCVGVLAFGAFGYAIAFGTGNDFMGTNGWFLGSNITENYLDGLTLSGPTFFIFQVAFAATAATIVSGAMAERTKFKSYVVYSFIITALVYPIVVHWTWGGGWLANFGDGYLDFAGSGIVHMTGGVAALVGAIFLGPRIGKYGPDGKPRAIPGHNIPFAIIGVFILLVGWFGFNPGSWLAADISIVSAVAVTTVISGAAGAVAAMLLIWIIGGKPDVAMAGNGLLAGLVGVTAGCAFVNNWGALIIGFLSGLLVVVAVLAFDRIKVDDPVGAISVHGVCGAFGALAVGLFATTSGSPLGEDSVTGLFYGGGGGQLWAQFVGVVAIAAFVGIAMTIVFGLIKVIMGLRVSEEEELAGLDVLEHGAPGYGEDIHTPLGAGATV
jgi:Amt family ammonium transporter